MQKFTFSIPSIVLFGRNCIEENAQIFGLLGKKACIVTGPILGGKVTGQKHIAVQDVENAMKSQGVEYAIFDNIESNPPVSCVVEAANFIADFDPDYVVAVGGGSVIDATKAAEILLKYPGHDVYETLFGNIAPLPATTKIPGTWQMGNCDNKKTPFISVPTTAGTGSEITAASVITREDIDNKAGTKPHVSSDYSFVDSRYIMTCDKKLDQSAAIDALGHGLECYIDAGSKDHYIVQNFAEMGFKLFREIKDHLHDFTMTDEDYDKQSLMSSVMGFCETLGQTGVPHGLGYPLTHIKELPHGLACGAFEAEYLKVFKDTSRVDRALELMGFSSVDEFAEYIHDILDPHMEGLTVTRDEIDAWTNTFYSTEWRVARHPEPFAKEDVKGIYERVLRNFIVD